MDVKKILIVLICFLYTQNSYSQVDREEYERLTCPVKTDAEWLQRLRAIFGYRVNHANYVQMRDANHNRSFFSYGPGDYEFINHYDSGCSTYITGYGNTYINSIENGIYYINGVDWSPCLCFQYQAVIHKNCGQCTATYTLAVDDQIFHSSIQKGSGVDGFTEELYTTGCSAIHKIGFNLNVENSGYGYCGCNLGQIHYPCECNESRLWEEPFYCLYDGTPTVPPPPHTADNVISFPVRYKSPDDHPENIYICFYKGPNCQSVPDNFVNETTKPCLDLIENMTLQYHTQGYPSDELFDLQVCRLEEKKIFMTIEQKENITGEAHQNLDFEKPGDSHFKSISPIQEIPKIEIPNTQTKEETEEEVTEQTDQTEDQNFIDQQLESFNKIIPNFITMPTPQTCFIPEIHETFLGQPIDITIGKDLTCELLRVVRIAFWLSIFLGILKLFTDK